MSEAWNRIRTFPEFRCIKIIMLVIQTTPSHNAVPLTFLTTADNPLSCLTSFTVSVIYVMA